MTTGVCGLGPHELGRLDGFLDGAIEEVGLDSNSRYRMVWDTLRQELVLSARPELRAAFAAGFERLKEWRALWEGRSLPAMRPGAPLTETDPIENVLCGVLNMDRDVFLAGLMQSLDVAYARDFAKVVEARKAELEETYRELVGTEGSSAEPEAAELVSV